MSIVQDLELVIARPPSAVFAQLIDVERWPEWLIASGIVRVGRVAPGDAGGAGAAFEIGTMLQIEQRVAGRAATLDARVTAMAPDTRFAVEGKDADGVSVGIDARLAPDGAGTTLRWQLKIGLPMRFRIFESMARPQVERAARLDLEAFRQRVEAAPAAS